MNDIKSQILQILKDHHQTLISGATIAKSCHITRSYVSKVIKELVDLGYEIEIVNRSGYIYQNSIKVLDENYLQKELSLPVKVLDKVDSTNNYIKRMAKEITTSYLLVLTNQQTAGKGRKGRNFVSNNNGGIYMSLYVKPHFDLEYVKKITCLTASAVALEIDKLTTLDTKIKWINDIYVKDKKICGILTEATTQIEEGRLEYIIIGIGINMYKQTFSDEIKKIATTLEDETGIIYSRNELVVNIIRQIIEYLNNIDNDIYMDEYLKKSFVIGKNVILNFQNKQQEAFVKDITREGELVVEINQKVQKVSSAEITRMVVKNE